MDSEHPFLTYSHFKLPSTIFIPSEAHNLYTPFDALDYETVADKLSYNCISSTETNTFYWFSVDDSHLILQRTSVTEQTTQRICQVPFVGHTPSVVLDQDTKDIYICNGLQVYCNGKLVYSTDSNHPFRLVDASQAKYYTDLLTVSRSKDTDQFKALFTVHLIRIHDSVTNEDGEKKHVALLTLQGPARLLYGRVIQSKNSTSTEDGIDACYIVLGSPAPFTPLIPSATAATDSNERDDSVDAIATITTQTRDDTSSKKDNKFNHDSINLQVFSMNGDLFATSSEEHLLGIQDRFLAVKHGVDAACFDLSQLLEEDFSNPLNTKQEIQLKHSLSFPAISFIRSAKRDHRVTLFTKHSCVLVDSSRWWYAYKVPTDKETIRAPSQVGQFETDNSEAGIYKGDNEEVLEERKFEDVVGWSVIDVGNGMSVFVIVTADSRIHLLQQ